MKCNFMYKKSIDEERKYQFGSQDTDDSSVDEVKKLLEREKDVTQN